MKKKFELQIKQMKSMHGQSLSLKLASQKQKRMLVLIFVGIHSHLKKCGHLFFSLRHRRETRTSIL